eukprot:2977675-Pleurochrysis_carterae.AAC.2
MQGCQEAPFSWVFLALVVFEKCLENSAVVIFRPQHQMHQASRLASRMAINRTKRRAISQ